MTPRRGAAACAAAFLSIASAVGLTGADAMDPRALLARLPSSTNLTVSVLNGVLKKTPGVDRWRVFVNDAIVFEPPADTGQRDTPLDLALILREGDNLVAIESIGVDTLKNRLVGRRGIISICG